MCISVYAHYALFYCVIYLFFRWLAIVFQSAFFSSSASPFIDNPNTLPQPFRSFASYISFHKLSDSFIIRTSAHSYVNAETGSSLIAFMPGYNALINAPISPTANANISHLASISTVNSGRYFSIAQRAK